ncbi:hypothetical protein M3J09_012088 [Ascochyta lentis]
MHTIIMKQEAGSRKQEAGSRKQEAGSSLANEVILQQTIRISLLAHAMQCT